MHGWSFAGDRAGRELRSREARAGMTRRGFLGTLGSFSAICPAFCKDAASIRTVEVFPVNYPVTAYFKFLPKPERPSVFVKVTCEDGTSGWGQSVPLPTWSYETL